MTPITYVGGPDEMNSSCTQAQQRQAVRWVSFGIYEPQNGCDIHDAVAHMVRVAAVLEQRNSIKVAILKSLEHSWVWMYKLPRLLYSLVLR
jgi:hypothetical protein